MMIKIYQKEKELCNDNIVTSEGDVNILKKFLEKISYTFLKKTCLEFKEKHLKSRKITLDISREGVIKGFFMGISFLLISFICVYFFSLMQYRIESGANEDYLKTLWYGMLFMWIASFSLLTFNIHWLIVNKNKEF